jgi:SAM-dependent methyltransferase
MSPSPDSPATPDRDALAGYYADRAPEHDRVYEKSERQADLQQLRSLVCGHLAGRRVLEIACGTGYWTQFLAASAREIVATDVNEKVLAVARERLKSCPHVRFALDDAFRLAMADGVFDAGFAGFWWSHVGRRRLPWFLDLFHARLPQGARVVFIDNRFVPGSSTPISRIDDEGNTFQRRRLDDGREYEVLKNFPSEDDLRQSLAGRAADLRCEFLDYYWCLSYAVV